MSDMLLNLPFLYAKVIKNNREKIDWLAKLDRIYWERVDSLSWDILKTAMDLKIVR